MLAAARRLSSAAATTTASLAVRRRVTVVACSLHSHSNNACRPRCAAAPSFSPGWSRLSAWQWQHSQHPQHQHQQRCFGVARRRSEIPTVHVVPRGHRSITQTFSLSGGKGGQNVNKVNTKVQLFFLVDDAEWLPDEVKHRLKAVGKKMLNKDGKIIITSTATRSQHTNLVDAYQKLQMLVDAATPEPKVVVIKKDPSKHSKKRMVEKKRRRSDVKKGRSKKFDDF